MVEHALSLPGQARAALAAVEQAGAEQFLQPFDPSADGRFAELQLARGAREGARTDYGGKKTEIIPIRRRQSFSPIFLNMPIQDCSLLHGT
jgi:hypothetical protein